MNKRAAAKHDDSDVATCGGRGNVDVSHYVELGQWCCGANPHVASRSDPHPLGLAPAVQPRVKNQRGGVITYGRVLLYPANVCEGGPVGGIVESRKSDSAAHSLHHRRQVRRNNVESGISITLVSASNLQSGRRRGRPYAYVAC